MTKVAKASTRTRASRAQDPAPPPRREQKKSATRRELVSAGRRLFSQEGIYSSRIEDIAHSAGIAKGTVYLYFASKEALLAAVVREAFEELQVHVRAHLVGQEPAALAEGIFRAHVEFYARNPDAMRILHQVRGVLKFSRSRGTRLRASLRAHVEFLAACLARGESARCPAERRRELALFLFGCASGSASVAAATYPEEARLAQLGETWAAPVAEAARAFAAASARRGTRRRS